MALTLGDIAPFGRPTGGQPDVALPHWDLVAGEDRLTAAVWSYKDPFPEAPPVAGRVSFLGEGIEVRVGPT